MNSNFGVDEAIVDQAQNQKRNNSKILIFIFPYKETALD